MKLLMLAGILSVGTVMADTVRVYVGTRGRGESKGIYLTELDTETGALAEPKLAAEVANPGFLVLSKDGKRLFSTAKAPGKDGEKGYDAVAGFAVQEDGMLTLKNYQQAHGKGPCFVSLDATGKMLLLANYGCGSVVAYQALENGEIDRSHSQHQHEGSSVNKQRQSGPHAHSIYTGPENKFAYAPDLGMDEVVIYELDVKSASMNSVGAVKMPPGSGPRHMKFGKDGKQAYVLAEMLLNVVVFDRKGHGLEQKEVVSNLPEGGDKSEMSCSEILVSKDGKFIYVANRDSTKKGRDSISVFAVGEGGLPKLIQTVGAEVHIPRNINVSPDGKWLLVAGQKEGGVPTFAVGEDGKLKFSGKRIQVANAMCIAFGE